MAERGNFGKIILFLIQSPIDTILDRRVADTPVKRRDCSRGGIIEEIYQENRFIFLVSDIFSMILSQDRVRRIFITNENLEDAKREMERVFEREVVLPFCCQKF